MFMRNTWYVAAESGELGDRPLGRILLGEPVVLYRTPAGVAALEDRCCHRRAPLHMGTVKGDTLQCGYHGFTFDASGACVWVPGQDRVPKTARVRSYAAVERHGWIWVWFGEGEPDATLIPDFFQNGAPGWAAAKGYFHLEANYLLYVDNLLDLSHVGFVHRGTIGADDADAEVKFERKGGIVEGVRRSPEIDTPPLYRKLGLGPRARQTKVMTFHPPCQVRIHITTTSGDKSTNVFILNAMTPETETSCHYHWAVARDFQVDDDAMTALMQAETVKAFTEDKVMVEAQQRTIDTDPASPFVSVIGDAGGLQARRLVDELVGARQA
jgi:phenylpropionate dioxygenase-like ring-hydroxylating dioxygenase large terminal subunit